MNRLIRSRCPLLLAVLGLLMALGAPARVPPARAASGAASVTLAGSLQAALGCSGDWQADCAITHLTYDAGDDVWQGSWELPAGSYEYKAALNDSWDVNYGLHAAAGGANIPLPLASARALHFYYDDKSHWITDQASSRIATAVGSFQHALGCAGDWDPGCLRSWLQDPDGDGVYTFETGAIPAGDYEAKVAIDEDWAENYGAGGVRDGSNITFTVTPGARVLFSFASATNQLSITLPGGLPAHDNNVEWAGLRHDSRDTLYRTPGGAVPAGTPVTLRFRTFHNDVTGVQLRVYDLEAGGQRIYPMSIAASDVSCYQDDLADQSCDFWSYTLPNGAPDNLWYRFIVADGSDTNYYGDDTPALDGGLGSVTDTAIDQSWALMVYDPQFSAPAWAKHAVIYQIFPDRFRNGRTSNDPRTGDPRYADPALKLPWGTKPEGYCQNYADADSGCPWRFDSTPPADSPAKEKGRSRDYMGGDLKGVDEQFDYLESLGVTAIYFNPIFDSDSNHGYDTQNYYAIDPYLGSQQDWQSLQQHARQRGIRIILDGVFNHMSSDSPFFDRYHRYPTLGACESPSSPYRSWFHFRAPSGSEPSPCAPSAPGGSDTYYESWAGFDSIPVLNKANPDVQKYFVTGANSVSRYWLKQGAAAWRLDVMGDASFPSGYWETFRQVVKAAEPSALIIGEIWQKDSTLLRFLRGDRADTAMNYRLRDAVLGLLAPGSFDSKGFADSGRVLKPSEFMARLLSVREDYPDAVYYSLMNLLDSHDTERLLWTLTPGPETSAERDQNAANLAAGKQRQRLAALIQYTVPGAPTLFYGDEVGQTGDDDPDDRRTYPWADKGGKSDQSLRQHYTALAYLRRASPALTNGDFRVLLADDANETLAFGRRTSAQAAVVALNRSAEARTIEIPVSGYLPDGTALLRAYGVGNPLGSLLRVQNGKISLALAPLSASVLVGLGDFSPPAAPKSLRVTAEGNEQIDLAWQSVPGARGYNVYRSPLSGGGWVKVNATPQTATSLQDSGLRNAEPAYYVVRALDGAGNESADSNEASGLPHYTIGWANVQWPPTLTHTISAITRTDTVYGQVWIDGVTSQPGATASLRAQLGFGPAGSNPASASGWTWVDASFNVDSGNNDEFAASLLPESSGSYDYVYRYSTTAGRDWLYADLSGPVAGGAAPSSPGKLTVAPSADQSAPATPSHLHVVSASPAGVELAWDANSGDPTLYGYELRRSGASGGPYASIALVSGGATSFTDTDVQQGATYYYVLRAVDSSFNRSADTPEVAATAELRTVTLTFSLSVPDSTDGAGKSVYIAGMLDRLDGGLPSWNPSGVVMTRVDATHWAVTLSGKEGTQIEYKYALGAWDYVEKDTACGEIANRQLTLSYGSSGAQQVNDAVLNWRNVAPCGN